MAADLLRVGSYTSTPRTSASILPSERRRISKSGSPKTAGAGIVYKLDPKGNQTVLYSFTGGSDGGYPYAGVIRDSAGNLYGTTLFGGPANSGVVYKVDPTGHETVLYGFAGGADGARPYAGVIRDSSGSLYGTAAEGGASNAGLVYKLDSTGQKTNLYSFPGMADGANPSSGLIRDSAGNFYGTAFNGGPANSGVVYKLSPAGQETVLHSFTGGADGANPYAGVVRDSSGNLYGTTFLGGASNAGVVYKVDSAGHETVLYTFHRRRRRSEPAGRGDSRPEGNLYGTASSGGTGWGVVFKLDATGHETVLYSFRGSTDGGSPNAGLARDSAGGLYGTTAVAQTIVVYRLRTLLELGRPRKTMACLTANLLYSYFLDTGRDLCLLFFFFSFFSCDIVLADI